MDLEKQQLDLYLRTQYGPLYISSNEELHKKYSSISNINLVFFCFYFFNYAAQDIDKFDYYREKARIQNVLNKVEAAFDASENIFVGQVIFDNDELDILYKYANIVLQNANYDFSFTTDEIKIIFAAIVNVAKDIGEDTSALFDSIVSKLHIESKNITKFMDALKNSRAAFVVDKIDKSTHRYNRNTILAHAISPRDSIDKFLDVCLQIYIRDFDYNFADSKQYIELIKVIIQRIDKICRRQETFDDPYLKKVLQCQAGIITLLPHRFSNQEPLTQFMKKIFICFNKISDGEFIINDYIDEIIDRWSHANNKLNTDSVRNHASVRRMYSSTMLVDEKPSPKFVVTDEGIEIVIPPFRIYDSGADVKCYIIKNDNVINTIDISSFYGYLAFKGCSSELVEIPLDEIIGPNDENMNFNLSINVGATIYSWPEESLSSNFLLFAFANKNEIHVNGCTTLPSGNYFIYIPPYGSIPDHPSCKVYKSSSNVFYFTASQGDSLFNIIYFIDKSRTDVPVFVYDSENKIFYTKDGDSTPISTVIPKFMIPCSQNPKELFVNIDDEKLGHRLSDIKTTIGLSGNYNLYNLDEIIGEIKKSEKISITNADGQKLTSLYLIPDIEVRYNKENGVYFASIDKTIKASLIYQGIVITELEKEIIETTSIEFDYLGGKIIANSPQIFSFRIKGLEGYDKKFTMPLDKIFTKKELTNNFTISLYPQSALFDVYLNDLQISDARNDKTYKIGELLFAMIDFDVNLKIKYKDTEIIIMQFQLSEFFMNNPLEIDFNARKIKWEPEGKELIGANLPEKFFLRIFDFNNKFMFGKELNSLTNTEIDLDVHSYPSGQYILDLSVAGPLSFLVDCIYKQTFFLGSENERLFWKKHVILKYAILEESGEMVRFIPLIDLYDINLLFMFQDGSEDIVYKANYVANYYNVNQQLEHLPNTAKASVHFEALNILLCADKSLKLELPGGSKSKFVIDNDTSELKIEVSDGNNENVSNIEKFVYKVEDLKK